MPRLLWAWVLGAAICWADAQAQTEPDLLEEVVVAATRIPTDQGRLPFATGVIAGEQVQRGRQQLGLDESMSSQPGIFFQNRYNFAQDLRIAIRGFGARANFGIRGIRIFADDIPQTLPDGQGSIDAIDLGSVQAIEVIRGPFAAVYGSSSGGVIHLRTEDGPERPVVGARVSAGSYGFEQWQAKAGGQAGRLNWLVNASTTDLDGYREHAVYANDLVNGKFRYDFDQRSSLTVLLNAVDSPLADDPGGLTAREAEADPRQAAPRNLQYDAGESLEQQTIGAAFSKEFDRGGELLLRSYYVQRDFFNRLPFDVNSNGQGGSVRLDRKFAGFGAQYGWSSDWAGHAASLVFGVDYDAQRDHRLRFANNQGVLGELTTNQDEDVTTLAPFVQAVVDLTPDLVLTAGGRFDTVEYRVTDRTASAASGQRTFREFSPMAGLSWSIAPGLRLYGNVSTSFDPPATTELANPFGPTGFNPEIESQTATNFEVGLKGLVSGRLRYELALFHIDVDDEIVPFELEGSGQSFYRNAGRSTHEGLEALVAVEILPGLTGSIAYSWSDFVYREFSEPGGIVHDGNRIPGIPEHLVNVTLDWNHSSGLYAGWDLLYAGRFYADNANAVETGDYLVSNLRAGFDWKHRHWSVEPFVGVSNLFDERYMSNIRLNAAFGRYYEPAPGRNFHGGLRVSYGFR